MVMLLAAAGQAQTTVTLYGADDPAIDLPAVQAAVNVPNSTVYLDGTFDFGETGSVLIDVPNITLEGASTGATIKRGRLPLRTYNGVLPSGAKSVTIRNIHFEGWIGWVIYHMGVQAEDNFTLIEGNTFTNTRAGDVAPYAMGVHYCTGAGSAEIKNNTFINLSYLAVSTHDLTLPPEDHLLIEGNKIIDCRYEAIGVDVWDINLVDYDNGPVIVRNNEISITPPLIDEYPGAIDFGGWYGEGISNAVIEGNTITGWGMGAIAVLFYGHNRKIIDNDLSGMTTWQAFIQAAGGDGLIAGNILGPVDKDFAASQGMLGLANAISVFSQDPFWLGDHPQPLPVTGNVITDNDFRLTGLKGWGYDAGADPLTMTPGCVLLFSTVDVFGDWLPGGEVTNNLVKETGRFPAGTGGPKQQVLEFPTHAHHNRIVGHAANEFAQLEASNPGIGQKIKESGAKFMEMLKTKQAFIKQLMEETEGH